MNARIINTIRKFVRSRGFDVVHYCPLHPYLHKVDLVLDVGANLGQTYDFFREAGYRGKIVSFEPNPQVFGQLQQKPGFDWEKQQLALSSNAGEVEFFVTSDSGYSGLHPHLSKPALEKIKVRTQRLDQIWKWDARSVFLKIDTEGHDLEVVKGATGVLDRIKYIMVETALIARYEREPILNEVVTSLAEFGFHVCKIQTVYTEPDGSGDKAMDLVFCRSQAI